MICLNVKVTPGQAPCHNADFYLLSSDSISFTSAKACIVNLNNMFYSHIADPYYSFDILIHSCHCFIQHCFTMDQKHARGEIECFLIREDRMQIFEGILFFEATNNTKTNNLLLPVGFFQKDVRMRLNLIFVFLIFFSERRQSTLFQLFY